MTIMNIACPICTDVFNNSDDIYTTSCGHIFHHNCMLDWQSRAPSCPQCRSCNPSTHKIYLSFEDSDENPKEIDELKVKVESSTAEIKRLYDQIKEGDENFLHLQEQCTSSVELIRELEERIRQAKYSETDFLRLQGEYTKSDNLIKELQEQVEFLNITNEINSKELSSKVTEISTFNSLNKELQEKVQLLTITNEFNSKELSLKVTEISSLKNIITELQEQVQLLTINKFNPKKLSLEVTEILTLKALVKELQEQVQLLTLTNEFNSKELSLKVTEISTLKTSLEEAMECPASDAILNDTIKILEQKLKHISAEFEKEITKSTRLSIDNMKLQSYIDCMKLKANLNESIQMVNGDNSILTQQANNSVDHSLDSNVKENPFMRLASNKGGNIKKTAKRGNLKQKSVLDQQNNNTLSMGISPLGGIRNSNEPVLNSKSPLTCRQNEVFSSNNITSIVIKDFPLNQISYPLENIIIGLASKMGLTITKEDLGYVCEMKSNEKHQLPNKVTLFVQLKSLDLKNQLLSEKNRLKDHPTTECLAIKEYVDDLTYSVFSYANRKLRDNGFQFISCRNNKVFAKKLFHDSKEIRIYSRTQVDGLIKKNRSLNESA